MGVWNDSLLIGVDEIDKQHRTLADKVDELLFACNQGRGITKISELLDYCIEYIKEHFSTEEKVQQQYGYPGFDEHKKRHGEFLLEVAALRRELRDKGLSIKLTGQTSRFLTTWLATHIKEEDAQIGAYIQNTLE